MSQIKQTILEELQRIEREEGVRILYACESGSRAWGFPSRDSDYDVRFLYIRPMEWYLSIFDKRDVIERPISDRLDINGWDLKKALRLFRKSNPPLLEWLQSPILYLERGSAASQIRGLASQMFSPRACMHHYLHMARGNYRTYLQGDTVKIKKYFYVLRPILACEWIEKHGAMPPMEFQRLADALIPEGSGLKTAVQELLARKIAGDEMKDEPKITVINEYAETKLAEYEQIAKDMRTAEGDEGGMDAKLDDLFRSVVYEGWEKDECDGHFV